MRAVEFMKKMLDVLDAEEAPVQQPVVINIVNGAPAEPPIDADSAEVTDPAQRIGSNGQPIMTPPLQQQLDTMKAGVKKQAPVATVAHSPVG